MNPYLIIYYVNLFTVKCEVNKCKITLCYFNDFFLYISQDTSEITWAHTMGCFTSTVSLDLSSGYYGYLSHTCWEWLNNRIQSVTQRSKPSYMWHFEKKKPNFDEHYWLWVIHPYGIKKRQRNIFLKATLSTFV